VVEHIELEGDRRALRCGKGRNAGRVIARQFFESRKGCASAALFVAHRSSSSAHVVTR
jgi:hypothetical protein